MVVKVETFSKDKKIKEEFIRINKKGDGRLSYDEFREEFRKFGFEIREDFLRKCFSWVDINDDNQITVEEFIEYVKFINVFNKTLKKKYENYFRSIDKEGKGYLTVKELLSSIGAIGVNIDEKLISQISKKLKNNSNSKISQNEFLRLLKIRHLQKRKNYLANDFMNLYEAVVRINFIKADKNLDGYLDFNEFREYQSRFGKLLGLNDLKKSFLNHDLKKDQKITIDEILDFIRSKKDFVNLMKDYLVNFKDIDTNNDGYLTADDIRATWASKGYNLSDVAVWNLINTFDMNKDGKIGLYEYLDILAFKHLEINSGKR